MTFRHILLRPV